jgi:hypothetical protein
VRPDDETLIRRVIDAWAIYRDTGDWDRFLALWHPRGRMVATWYQGPPRDFVAMSRRGFGKGAQAHHVLGGTAVDIAGPRGIARSRMTLHLRTNVDGMACDIGCLGLFVDFLIREDDRWLLAMRQPVYEKDWIAPCDPAAKLDLAAERLALFPAGYRHLGYAQAQAGMTVDRELPGADGPAADALACQALAWLDGAATDIFCDA